MELLVRVVHLFILLLMGVCLAVLFLLLLLLRAPLFRVLFFILLLLGKFDIKGFSLNFINDRQLGLVLKLFKLHHLRLPDLLEQFSIFFLGLPHRLIHVINDGLVEQIHFLAFLKLGPGVIVEFRFGFSCVSAFINFGLCFLQVLVHRNLVNYSFIIYAKILGDTDSLGYLLLSGSSQLELLFVLARILFCHLAFVIIKIIIIVLLLLLIGLVLLI